MVFYKRSSNHSSSSSYRPLPLKQRTSSKDTRRDYTHNTWTSLLVLLKIREFIITVDNFSIWRRHLAWAMENGNDLKLHMTQRYASNMVFMSLLLSTELGVLYNSATVTTTVRQQLREGEHGSLSFWAGLFIIISALLTILSLISTFTAWAMVNSVDANNAHCIFRSSIGQYAAELPGRLIVGSIYSFLISFVMYFFLLLPFGIWSITLLASTVFLFLHIVSVFSALGRVIMHTGAMGNGRIFSPEYEDLLLPHTLHSNLLAKSKANLENNTSIIRQYRRTQNPIDRFLTEDELYDHLCGRLGEASDDFSTPNRSRTDSIVRFADEHLGHPKPTHNARNVTPLSDISISTDPEPSPHPAVKKTTSNLQRPKFAGRPPATPPPDSFGANGLWNVSSSSLEQWLQASPKNSIGEISNASDRSFSDGASSSHAPPPPPIKQGTPPINKGTKTASPSIPRPATPVPGTVVSSETQKEKSYRELTEDERFMMDYGDIDDGRANGHLGENIGGERMSLLENNRAYSPYGDSHGSDSLPHEH
jgi:hypothetical protein